MTSSPLFSFFFNIIFLCNETKIAIIKRHRITHYQLTTKYINTQPKQEKTKANAQYHRSLNKPTYQNHLKLDYPKNHPLEKSSDAPWSWLKDRNMCLAKDKYEGITAKKDISSTGLT